jgi:hypothetical protein
MSKALLILIVSIFLVVIGGGILKRTHMAVAPPIYDPIGYYARAQIVWSAVAKGDLPGILNGPMSVRPPGTVFVLYPFGFKPSVHRFLFRSTLAPILIWVLALSVPIISQVRRRSDALLGAAFIIGLATMPLFYQFELNETFTKVYEIGNQWGMVDSLQAAIAALAVSVLCLGIAKRSVKWCTIGWVIGAFSFFIKPSGLLVMTALTGVATAEFLNLLFGPRSSRRSTLEFAALVYLIGFSVFGVALWLAFGSQYMSREVIIQSIKGQQFVLALNKGRDLFGMLGLFVVPVFGSWWFWPGFVFGACVVFTTVRSVIKRQWSAVGVRLVTAALILVSAVCWWMFLAGQEHRYLFPFLLMVIAWFVPDVFRWIREFRPVAKGAVIGYCVVPAVLLGGMIWSERPPIVLQQMMGVNLTAGGRASEVNQGKWLLAESERLRRPLNLYLIGEFDVGVVEMIDWVNSVQKNNLPHRFVVRRPLNWIDTPGLRCEELVESDFLLLEAVPAERIAEPPVVSSWPEEVERFKQFAYSERGVDKNGLELVSDGSVKLLRIADAGKFSESLCAWANSIHWTDDFRERNKVFLNPPKK